MLTLLTVVAVIEFLASRDWQRGEEKCQLRPNKSGGKGVEKFHVCCAHSTISSFYYDNYLSYVSGNRVFGELGLAKGGRKSANYVRTSGGKVVEKFHVCALSTISSF